MIQTYYFFVYFLILVSIEKTYTVKPQFFEPSGEKELNWLDLSEGLKNQGLRITVHCLTEEGKSVLA